MVLHVEPTNPAVASVLGRAGARRGSTVLCFGAASLLVSASLGCAKPCVDDGLGQKYCPEDAGGDADADAGSGSDSGTDDSPGTDDGGTQCGVLDVTVEALAPTVIVLADRSGSMTTVMGGGAQTRWEVLSEVLVDPTSGIITSLAGSIRFGVTLYSNDGTTCPTMVEEPPATNNVDALAALFQNNDPVGDTPTGESLELVADALDADAGAMGDKIIVLATDGEPDTCAMPNPQEGQPEALAATQYAFGLGIRTFVIGVGDENTASHMQNMANAGQGVQAGEPDAEFYVALDQAELVSAFAEVFANARHCKLELSQDLDQTSAAACTLEVDGQVVPFGDPDGWELDAPNRAQLVGAACESIQGQTVAASMTCPC